MKQRTALPFALAPLMLLASCSSSGSGGGGYDVGYHTQIEALPAFNYDTGYQPASSPVQVEALLSAAGGETIDARARGTGDGPSSTLTGVGGSGRFTMDAHFLIAVKLKVEATGVHYEGPIEGAPNIDVAFGGTTSFDPFLVGGSAEITAQVPETMVATIPLAGAVPIPRVQGNLVLRVSGTLHSTFSGVCAATADGNGEYHGVVVTDGMLIVKPSVEISVLTYSHTLEPYDVPVPIPPITTQVTLDPHRFAAGEDAGVVTSDGGMGTVAMAGMCGDLDAGGADGAAGPDGAVEADGAVDVDGGATDGGGGSTDAGSAPGELFALCGSDAECSSGVCLSAYPGGLCSANCTTDADCQNLGVCLNNLCLPKCNSVSSSACQTYGAICLAADSSGQKFVCIPSCDETPAAGGLACNTGVSCDPYSGFCTDAPSTGADNGAPCTTPDECRGGQCLTEYVGSDPTGWLGGYCASIAMQADFAGNTLPQSNCPAGSVVIPDGSPAGAATFCFKTCTSAADCRNGYACSDLSQPDGTDAGYTAGTSNRVCLPANCRDPRPGNACPTGTHCVDYSQPGYVYGICVRG